MKKAVAFGLVTALLTGWTSAFAAQQYSRGDRVKHMGWQYRDPTDETGLAAPVADKLGMRCGYYGAVLDVAAKDTYKVRILGFKSNCEELMERFAKTPQEKADGLMMCAVQYDKMARYCSMNLAGNVCSEFYTLNDSHINLEIEVPGNCLEPDNQP